MPSIERSTTNIVLMLLFIAQLGLLSFWQLRGSVAPPSAEALVDIALDEVQSLEVVDAAGSSLNIERLDGAWVLANSDGFPVQASAIDPLLAKLLAIRNDSLVAQKASSHARLKVAENDFEKYIELQGAGKNIALYFGTSPRASSIHVRRGDQNAVYIGRDIQSFDLRTTLSAYIDSNYINIAPNNLLALDIERDGQSYSFSPLNDNGNWRLDADEAIAVAGLAPEDFDPDKIDEFVRSAQRISLTTPMGTSEEASYGLDEPVAIARYSIASEGASEVVELLIGAELDGQRVIKASNQPHYVRASGLSVGDIVGLSLESFLADEEISE